MEIFNLIRNEKNEKYIIDYINKNNIDINIKDEDSYNMLMVAITRNLYELSRYLVSKNIDLNHQNYKGMSSLHILAFYYNKDILEDMLAKNIDISIRDDHGNSALWTTIMNDKGFGTRLEMIELLLNHGADKNQLNSVNKSPLQIAKILNYPEIIKLLEKDSI